MYILAINRNYWIQESNISGFRAGLEEFVRRRALEHEECSAALKVVARRGDYSVAFVEENYDMSTFELETDSGVVSACNGVWPCDGFFCGAVDLYGI